MRRRTALKNIGAITAGIFLLPGCKNQLHLEWVANSPFIFNKEQQNWIAVISESILPKNDLILTTYESFPEFLAKMIQFDKPESDQVKFVEGYNQCTKEMKEQIDQNPKEIQSSEIVAFFDNFLDADSPPVNNDQEQKKKWEDQQFFCKLMRAYSIQHFRTSKEYQQDILEYQLVPVAYEPCVSV